MSLVDRLQNHLREEKRGIFHDAIFALAWVTFISLLFDYVFVTAPTWTYYLFMLCGIPAYFGFFISLDMALAQAESE